MYSSRLRPAWRAAAARARRSAFSVRTGMRLLTPVGVVGCPPPAPISCSSSSRIEGSSGSDCCCCCWCWRRRCCNAGGMTTLTFGLGNSEGLGTSLAAVSVAGLGVGVGVALTFSCCRCLGILLGCARLCAVLSFLWTQNLLLLLLSLQLCKVKHTYV